MGLHEDALYFGPVEGEGDHLDMIVTYLQPILAILNQDLWDFQIGR